MKKLVNIIYACPTLLALLILAIFSISFYKPLQPTALLNNNLKSVNIPLAVVFETFESTFESNDLETAYDHPFGQLLPNALSILCLYFINHLESYTFVRAPLLYLLFSTPPPFL